MNGHEFLELPYLGLDLGNSVTKAVCGTRPTESVELPTAILRMTDGLTHHEESHREWLNALDVTIASPALPKKARYRVGSAVTSDRRRGDRAKEPVKGDKKVGSEPVLVCGLTTLGALVLQQHETRAKREGALAVRITFLVTALPYQQHEETQGRLKTLLKGEHILTFHDLPGLGSVTVTLRIRNLHVFPEGLPAALASIYMVNRDGQVVTRPGRGELLREPIGVLDVGGGTTDALVFDAEQGKWSLNTDLSRTFPMGINDVLDTAAARLRDLGFSLFQTRGAVAAELKRQSRKPLEERIVINRRDQVTVRLLETLANDDLRILGERVQEILTHFWNESIGHFLVVGGGAMLLHHGGYLRVPFRQQPEVPDQPEWANAAGCFLFGAYTLQNQQRK